MSSLADLFAREVSSHCARRLQISADAAWKIAGDIASDVPAGGMADRISIEGHGQGAIRTFHLRGGARIVERIEEFDPQERLYVYRILDGGPLDVARYLGMVSVAPAGPEACILSWSAMAQPVGTDPASLRAVLEANLNAAVEAVARHLESTPPS